MFLLANRDQSFPKDRLIWLLHEIGNLNDHLHQIVIAEKEVSVDAPLDTFGMFDPVESPNTHSPAFSRHVMNATDYFGVQTILFCDEKLVHDCFPPAPKLRRNQTTLWNTSKLNLMWSALNRFRVATCLVSRRQLKTNIADGTQRQAFGFVVGHRASPLQLAARAESARARSNNSAGYTSYSVSRMPRALRIRRSASLSSIAAVSCREQTRLSVRSSSSASNSSSAINLRVPAIAAARASAVR